MKFLDFILKSYQYQDASDFATSIFPSVKYGLFLLVISVSGFAASIEVLLGFKYYTFIAFLVGAAVELISGIYASVFVNKEAFLSTKLGRFLFKFLLLMVGLYMIKQFGSEWEGKNDLIKAVFDWVYAFIFSLGAFEYLVSVLENYAVVQGKPKDYYTSIINRKTNQILDIPKDETV